MDPMETDIKMLTDRPLAKSGSLFGSLTAFTHISYAFYYIFLTDTHTKMFVVLLITKIAIKYGINFALFITRKVYVWCFLKSVNTLCNDLGRFLLFKKCVIISYTCKQSSKIA